MKRKNPKIIQPMAVIITEAHTSLTAFLSHTTNGLHKKQMKRAQIYRDEFSRCTLGLP